MATTLRHPWGKNGKVITLSEYPKETILYSDQVYDFTFNIKTEDNYFGKAEIDLIKYDHRISTKKPNAEIICDKTS